MVLSKFFCDGNEIYEREVVLGNNTMDDDFKEDGYEEYQQSFNTSYITSLTKCANQSGNVHIYVHKDLPLKIKMKVGTLGDLTVLIKSKERIALERKLEMENISREQDNDNEFNDELTC